MLHLRRRLITILARTRDGVTRHLLVLSTAIAACVAALAIAGILRPRPMMIFHGSDGSPASREELLSILGGAAVVAIGEEHDSPWATAFETELLEDLALPGDCLAIEGLVPAMTPALDGFFERAIGEAELRQRLHEKGLANPQAYIPLLDTARTHRMKVFTATVPRELTSIVRSRGFDALKDLPPAAASHFHIPEDEPAGAADAFMEEMARASGHSGARKEELIGYFRVQLLQDATLARFAAEAARGSCRRVFIILGRFHIEFAAGFSYHFFRYAKELPLATVGIITQLDGSAVPEARLGHANFLVYSTK